MGIATKVCFLQFSLSQHRLEIVDSGQELVYTHRNSKFRFSENILGPSLKITQSANPRDTSVSLAVCLNHNFQI